MVGYNRYPDEKGTERLLFAMSTAAPVKVTTVTPMKRGLKAPSPREVGAGKIVTTVTPMKRGLKALCCFGKRVTTVTPMKRGLKEGLQCGLTM